MVIDNCDSCDAWPVTGSKGHKLEISGLGNCRLLWFDLTVSAPDVAITFAQVIAHIKLFYWVVFRTQRPVLMVDFGQERHVSNAKGMWVYGANRKTNGVLSKKLQEKERFMVFSKNNAGRFSLFNPLLKTDVCGRRKSQKQQTSRFSNNILWPTFGIQWKSLGVWWKS